MLDQLFFSNASDAIELLFKNSDATLDREEIIAHAIIQATQAGKLKIPR